MSAPHSSADEPVPSAWATTEEAAPPAAGSDGAPTVLGRYHIEGALGGGTFGVVYRGRDDILGRAVAIKVPRRELVEALGGIDAYLREARVLAGLDHPHIVPVHDAGHTADGLCYVVHGFIEGGDLKACLAQRRFSPAEAARLVAPLAEALQHAHQKGVYHRDVKPANILVDKHGKAYLADFGLALRHQDYGRGPAYLGTPAYMSPEQARGEGHRVDGRADVFSLGAVFYELLTGQRAFQGSAEQLRERIARGDVRPPRQLDAAIPAELERIRLKALARLVGDRYTTAADLADDLRAWLADAAPDSRPATPPAPPAPAASSVPVASVATEPPLVRVVPKGLRSFDADDADFFLDLLPGPRDRHGLPDSLRFWKARIEPNDPERTFAVGLLYGPSGCGKSSLVKAGLLPRLAGHVTAVYVEATAEDTEARLRRGLHKRCPALGEGLGLADSVAALRGGRGLAPGQKVLLVLDQFEQWLHAHATGPDQELVRALRQCDGGRVQALLLVRDDFWLAVSRFLSELEVEIRQGENTALVDLFDPLHARKVLAEFGRAFGRLPDHLGDRTREQEAFLDQALAGLAQDGKVISVRLALFADMVKGKPWEPATLHAVGGIAGVGLTFLEETFSAATANPRHRLHQHAARAVLKALLPERGSDIKGNMRSHADLLAACGFAGRPRDFAELLRILDGDLRLITPTDPEGAEETQARRASEGASEPSLARRACEGRFYQLTHDYLVPSLREWLTRKQRETRRGRAELRLTERASLWANKPENRHLPAWWEWLNIRLFTRKTDWTPPQKTMMRKAARYHGVRGAVLAVVLAVITLAGLAIRDRVVEERNATRAAGLVRSLRDADTAQVPDLVRELDGYRPWADPLLRQDNEQAADGSRQKLHTALALLPVEAAQRDFLCDRLLDADPRAVAVLRDALRPHGEELRDRLWSVAEAPPPDRPGQRLRAAYALAAYDRDSDRWANVAGPLGRQLVSENVVHLGVWLDGFRPVKGRLLPPLAEVFRDRSEARAGERSLATSILADYADTPEALADLLLDADDKQFAALFPKLQAHGARAAAPLLAELDRQATFRWDDKPLDPAWQSAAAATVRQIEAAQGLVAERFALCQTLPLEEFPAVAEALRPAGYRPLRVRPFGRGPGAPVLVAALWMRDGRDWRLRRDLAAEAVAAADAEQQKQGYRPADVAGYGVAGAERYAVLWVRGDDKAEAKLYASVSARGLLDAAKALRPKEFQPATLHVLTLPGDAVRYSSLWRKPAPAGSARWDESERDYADQLALDVNLPIDVALTFSDQPVRDVASEAAGWLAGTPWALLAYRSGQRDSADPRRRFASTWQADGTREYADVRGLDPAAHRQRCRELAARGYRPAALAVAEERPGQALLAASVWHRPVVAEEDRERLAKRQASAGVALLRLGEGERVWPLLKHSPDPRVRSYLVHRLSPLGADPETLVQRLGEEPDVTIRRALLLGLGQFGEGELPAARRETLLPRLFALYRDDPDPGMHGSAAWVLGRWGQRPRLKEIDGELAGRDKEAARAGRLPAGGRRWYVNGQGQTLMIVPGPSPFWMGSPRTEKEREGGPENRIEQRHRKVVGRNYALAAHEVTVAQFRKFKSEHDYNKTYSPTSEHPVNQVSWYQAAEYCNWLSEEEGIPPGQWCYEINPLARDEKRVKLRPNYLSLSGYRLPSEAEWECACRAGAATARHYGETDELLGRYSWYTKVSADKGTLPAGSLEPNDLGLFDMQGNVMEWCQEQVFYYRPSSGEEPAPDKEYMQDISDKDRRVLRGGAFSYQPWVVRSSNRDRLQPTYRDAFVGFRPARTFP